VWFGIHFISCFAKLWSAENVNTWVHEEENFIGWAKIKLELLVAALSQRNSMPQNAVSNSYASAEQAKDITIALILLQLCSPHLFNFHFPVQMKMHKMILAQFMGVVSLVCVN